MVLTACAENELHYRLMKQAGINHMLFSYYYIKHGKWNLDYEKISHENQFVIFDSGAHTLQRSDGKSTDAFFENYLNFVKMHQRKKNFVFVELDIDNVVGIKKVEDWREQLLSIRKDTIIVWHKWTEKQKGKELWGEYCKNYEYVGLPNKDLKYCDPKKFLEIAKDYGTKVHGFAMTKPKLIDKLNFYSVDSITWLYASLSGHFFQYQNGTLQTISKDNFQKLTRKQFNKANYRFTELWSLLQWKKYAEALKFRHGGKT